MIKHTPQLGMPRPALLSRRVQPAVAGIFACLWLFAMASAVADGIRILPLGDSITRGSNFNGDIPGGYRKKFAARLASDQLGFDFVGSKFDNSAFGMDPHHHGIEGQTTANVLAELSGVLALDPDIVLLHVGTNDALQGVPVSTAANNLSALIDQITTGKPDRQLYVATIIPIWQGLGNRTQAQLNAAADAYNIEVRSRVAQFVSQGRNVRLVDMNKNLDYNGFFAAGDWIHPGQVGFARMGASWHAAVTAEGTLLKAPPVGAPVAPKALVARVISSKRINLKWKDRSPNETGFEVHAKSAEGLWEDIGSAGVNQTFFSATGLTVGVDRWYFRTRAVNGAGASSWSNLAVVIPQELAQGKPASASSIFANAYSAAKANDGQIGTAWVSEDNDTQASWTVDLGAAYRLLYVQLVTRQDYDYPGMRAKFQIRASTKANFSTYTVLASQGETPLAHRSTFSAGITLTSPFRYLRVAKTDGTELTIAELRVFGVAAPAAIATHPASKTINRGTATTLSVVAKGTAPFTYQWYRGTAGTTTTPVGTNSPSFATPALTATTSYWVKVTNAAKLKGAKSNTATVTVIQPTALASQPAFRMATLTINQPAATFHTWAASHTLTGDNALPSATPAGDGINNLMKYALGLDPNVTSVSVTDGINPGLPSYQVSGGFMTFTFIKDSAKSDLAYTVESCVDNTSWHPVTTGIVETPLAGTRVRVVVTIPASERAFCRLRVAR